MAPESELISTYDEVPYASYPYVQTHPDRLATVAHLFGMSAPALEDCSVLELGCAGGGNLIPLAEVLPEARFLGIDLSGQQIREGREAIEAIGLDNIELRHASILDVDEGFGAFDYIICHGVYSWVPREVQDHILRVCDRNLTPDGVAYVSYNTYPGWHMRGMVRDMMLFHSQRFSGADERVRQARALLDFLATSVPRQEGPYGQMLKEEVELLRDKSDHYLFHEHLEPANEPLYFHQFIERVTGAGLQFLGEAEVRAMAAFAFPEEVRATLSRLSTDIYHSEQYLDFLYSRTFRQSLLCRPEASLRRHIDQSSIAGLRVASSLRPEHDPVDHAPHVRVCFVGKDNVSLETEDSRLKMGLSILAERWPGSVDFDELVRETRRKLHAVEGALSTSDEDERLLATRLLTYYLSGTFIELHLLPDRCVRTPGERPLGALVARHQASSDAHVTNLRHELVRLRDADRRTLCLLDGTRSREDLIAELESLVHAGELSAERGSTKVEDPAAVREVASNALDEILDRLGRLGLLAG